MPTACPRLFGVSVVRLRPGRCGSAQISAIAFTPTISAASTTATGSSGAHRPNLAPPSARWTRFPYETDDRSSLYWPAPGRSRLHSHVADGTASRGHTRRVDPTGGGREIL